LYEDFWKIYTDDNHQPPIYAGPESNIQTCIISEGCEIMGSVYNSVVGGGVIIEEGAVVRDSIIMDSCVIGHGSYMERCIVDSSCYVGKYAHVGVGDNVPNEDKPNIYDSGITVIGEQSLVPEGVRIGKNCVIYGATTSHDYPNGVLESGQSIIRGLEGEQ
jgi:glucose-1-phosphate adenylyltransferase